MKENKMKEFLDRVLNKIETEKMSSYEAVKAVCNDMNVPIISNSEELEENLKALGPYNNDNAQNFARRMYLNKEIHNTQIRKNPTANYTSPENLLKETINMISKATAYFYPDEPEPKPVSIDFSKTSDEIQQYSNNDPQYKEFTKKILDHAFQDAKDKKSNSISLSDFIEQEFEIREQDNPEEHKILKIALSTPYNALYQRCQEECNKTKGKKIKYNIQKGSLLALKGTASLICVPIVAALTTLGIASYVAGGKMLEATRYMIKKSPILSYTIGLPLTATLGIAGFLSYQIGTIELQGALVVQKQVNSTKETYKDLKEGPKELREAAENLKRTVNELGDKMDPFHVGIFKNIDLKDKRTEPLINKVSDKIKQSTSKKAERDR